MAKVCPHSHPLPSPSASSSSPPLVQASTSRSRATVPSSKFVTLSHTTRSAPAQKKAEKSSRPPRREKGKTVAKEGKATGAGARNRKTTNTSQAGRSEKSLGKRRRVEEEEEVAFVASGGEDEETERQGALLWLLRKE
jgi:hypothetical protein